MLGMNTSRIERRDEGEKSMETRQIVAVVLIVVIIAGVGVGVWLFMPTAPYGAVLVGQSIGIVNSIETVPDIIDTIIKDAEKYIKKTAAYIK